MLMNCRRRGTSNQSSCRWDFMGTTSGRVVSLCERCDFAMNGSVDIASIVSP
jgi:hypothetical protein